MMNENVNMPKVMEALHRIDQRRNQAVLMAKVDSKPLPALDSSPWDQRKNPNKFAVDSSLRKHVRTIHRGCSGFGNPSFIHNI